MCGRRRSGGRTCRKMEDCYGARVAKVVLKPCVLVVNCLVAWGVPDFLWASNLRQSREACSADGDIPSDVGGGLQFML